MAVNYSIQKWAVLGLLGLFGAGGLTGAVYAQAIDINKINKIPRYETLPEAEFIAKSKEFTEIPQGDKYLEYSIRLRDGWQKLEMTDEEREAQVKKIIKKEAPADPFDISNLRDKQLVEEKNNVQSDEFEDSEVADIDEENGNMMSVATKTNRHLVVPKDTVALLGPVARYIGPANILAPSRLEIFALQMQHDITTRNWFLDFILSHNYTLTGMQHVSDNRVDAEYVLIEKGISYVVRTAAISSGSRMILISYFVPEQFWEKERGYQQQTIDSFKFLNPEKTKIDDKRTHGFLDLVKFTYPVAWKLLAPNVYSMDNMTAKLIYSVDDKILDGEIDISLISTEVDTTLMKEVDYLRQDLKKRGFVTGKALDTMATYSFSDKITFSRVEAYEVSGSKKGYIDYEYWLAIMVEDRYYYIVTMLTPGRGADFYKWARNTETFGAVIQSLMPQKAGETLDANFMNKVSGTDSGGAPVVGKK